MSRRAGVEAPTPARLSFCRDGFRWTGAPAMIPCRQTRAAAAPSQALPRLRLRIVGWERRASTNRPACTCVALLTARGTARDGINVVRRQKVGTAVGTGVVEPLLVERELAQVARPHRSLGVDHDERRSGRGCPDVPIDSVVCATGVEFCDRDAVDLESLDVSELDSLEPSRAPRNVNSRSSAIKRAAGGKLCHQAAALQRFIAGCGRERNT